MSANGGDKGGVYALEQWSLTGGSASSFAISVFFILPASSSERPFTRSVIYELEAMALPQPNVLNLTSEMIPLLWGAVERFLFPHGRISLTNRCTFGPP